MAGLGIPDLTTGFSKAYNSVIKNSVLPNSEFLQQIQKGIDAHYQADKMFHNSPVFMNLTSQTIQAFNAAGLNRERLRLSVIAHVAVELMIDRQILLADEQIAHDYYAQLDGVKEDLISVYFDTLSLHNEKQNFLSRFQFFRQRRFIYLFKDIENIVTGLGRIYRGVTKVEFSDHENAMFLNALNNIDGTIRYSWKEILNVNSL